MSNAFTSFSDQELLRLTQQKNEQAFAILYERYYLSLYKKAYLRIPHQARVEEIIQDVFVNLWQKAESLDTEGNIRAYLYATLRNKILHELRTESNRIFYMKKLKELGLEREKDKPTLQKIYAKETEATIQEIIMTLPPQCRKAFKLSRFEGLSYKEIAEQMQISVNTVEKHIGKALRVLRANIRPFKRTLILFIFLSHAFLCFG